jgi:hypothetical protein
VKGEKDSSGAVRGGINGSARAHNSSVISHDAVVSFFSSLSLSESIE